MLVSILALGFLCAPSAAEGLREAPPRVAAAVPVPDVAKRIAVLGASVSAGTGLRAELVTKGDLPLGRFLAAAMPPEWLAPGGEEDERVEIFDHGDMWFFVRPLENGAAQVNAALDHAPTLVVALDFLFWYGYGSGYASDDARLEDLERGLAQLDRFACPLVVGDFPDVRAALDGKGPLGMPLVTPDMIPRPVALDRLNLRLADWASERPRVSVVALGPMLTRMRNMEELTLRGNAWRPESLLEVLQPDLLHPTVRGEIWVAMAVLDALARAHPSLDAIDFDERRILARVLAETAEEREKELAKRAEREARRRRSDERREKAGAKDG